MCTEHLRDRLFECYFNRINIHVREELLPEYAVDLAPDFLYMKQMSDKEDI